MKTLGYCLVTALAGMPGFLMLLALPAAILHGDWGIAFWLLALGGPLSFVAYRRLVPKGRGFSRILQYDFDAAWSRGLTQYGDYRRRIDEAAREASMRDRYRTPLPERTRLRLQREYRSMSARLVPVTTDFIFPAGMALKSVKRMTGPHATVDLNAYTCDCEIFRDECAQHPRTSPKRLCRHLSEAVGEEVATSHPYMIGISFDRYRAKHTHFAELWINGIMFCWVGIPTRGAPFFGVYARKKKHTDNRMPGSGDVQFYLLATQDDHWAYGESPYGASRIKTAMWGLGVWRR